MKRQRRFWLVSVLAVLALVLSACGGAASPTAAPTLARYDELRRIRRGVAVARIDRNMCLGCRTTLSTSEVQKARQGQVAYCSSCGRILYAGH